jgi:two-component system LytT family response regulator
MSKKLSAILVDDEPLALRFLQSTINDFDSVDVICACNSGRDALSAIKDFTPDLLFLDIQMPGMNGFELVKNIQADIMPMIIFVTAYDQFAIAAFDLHAVDYLLKPLDASRVAVAIERAVERANNPARLSLTEEGKGGLISAIASMSDKVDALSQARKGLDGRIDATEPAVRKISIKDGDTITVVDEANIDWIDAAGDYMCIHVDGATHIMRSTLSDLLGRLDQNTFKRIHRSTVVNVDRIRQVQRHTKGEYFLHLDCDQTLKASRHYREVVKEILELNH